MNKLLEFKNDIINDYNNDISIKKLAKKYNSSYSTMQRFLNKCSDESNSKENSVQSDSKSIQNDSKSTESCSNSVQPKSNSVQPNSDSVQNVKKSIQSDSKSVQNVKNSIDDDNITSKSESIHNSFNEMLDNIKNIKKDAIHGATPASCNEIIKNSSSKKLINDVIEKNKLNKSVASIKPLNKTINKSIKIKKLNEEQNISFIHDIKADNKDELKLKRTNMIIIRQYLNTFDNELKKIYGNNKEKFIKNLMSLNNNELLCILEQIRCELNIKRNSNIFENVIQTGAITFENILLKIFNIDVVGCFDEMKNDPEFSYELAIIACEYDISSYLDPKKVLFIKMIKNYYLKYKENKIMQQLKNIEIDKNKLNKINENEKYKDL